eukprot:GHVL01007180.1.p1 GENE.GHVL01007180.1~~GHVL01007180.1.p1  ORF type:complete len:276 (-),score=18.35 GHVL01007180.1:775-1602(-)
MSLFSGQKLYFEYMYQLYNVVFTSLPIFLFGILDQDVSAELSLQHPELYHLGLKHYYFNRWIMLQWILNGIWHSIVVFGIPFFAFPGTVSGSNGMPMDIWTFGSVLYLIVILVVNLKVLFETYYMTWISHLVFFLSIAAWYIVIMVLSTPLFAVRAKLSPEMLGVPRQIFANPLPWIVIIETVIIALLRDLWWKSFKRSFLPESYHIIQRCTYQPKNSSSTLTIPYIGLTTHLEAPVRRLTQSASFSVFAYTEPDKLQTRMVNQNEDFMKRIIKE